jgi:hypothetical protein
MRRGNDTTDPCTDDSNPFAVQRHVRDFPKVVQSGLHDFARFIDW